MTNQRNSYWQFQRKTQQLWQWASLPFSHRLRGAHFFLKRFLILLYSRSHFSRSLITLSCGSLSIIGRMVAEEGILLYFENAFSRLSVSFSSHSVLRLAEDRVEGSSKSSSQSETFSLVFCWAAGGSVVLCSFRTRWRRVSMAPGVTEVFCL